MAPQLCYESIQYTPAFSGGRDADLPAQIAAAAAAGFAWFGIDADSVAQFVAAGGRVEELALHLGRAGLRCFELQALIVSDDEAATRASAESLAEIAQVLRPPFVQGGVTSQAGPDVTGNLRRAAEILAPCDTTIALEFLPMTPLRDIAGTRELIADAGIEAKVVVDTWHFFHGPDDWAALETLPLEEIAYVQFDDHPPLASDDLMAETIGRRVLPGEGVFELERFCRILSAKGYDAPVSVEILSDEMRSWAPERFARAVFEAAARFFPQ